MDFKDQALIIAMKAGDEIATSGYVRSIHIENLTDAIADFARSAYERGKVEGLKEAAGIIGTSRPYNGLPVNRSTQEICVAFVREILSRAAALKQPAGGPGK